MADDCKILIKIAPTNFQYYAEGWPLLLPVHKNTLLGIVKGVGDGDLNVWCAFSQNCGLIQMFIIEGIIF